MLQTSLGCDLHTSPASASLHHETWLQSLRSPPASAPGTGSAPDDLPPLGLGSQAMKDSNDLKPWGRWKRNVVPWPFCFFFGTVELNQKSPKMAAWHAMAHGADPSSGNIDASCNEPSAPSKKPGVATCPGLDEIINHKGITGLQPKWASSCNIFDHHVFSNNMFLLFSFIFHSSFLMDFPHLFEL